VRCLLAVLGHYVLALLHIGCVHHHVILLVAGLVIVGLARGVQLYVVGGVALTLLVVVTAMAIPRSSMSNTSK